MAHSGAPRIPKDVALNHARSQNQFLTTAARRLTALCGAVSAIAMVAAGAADGPSTTLVSRAYDGGPALTRAESREAVVSEDGRFVAFVSNGLNLAPDANGQFQVFVRDRASGSVELVSRTNSGAPADSSCSSIAISGDGRYVAFASDAHNFTGREQSGFFDVFLRDRVTGTTELVSVGDRGQRGDLWSGRYPVAMTPDGRFIAFDSDATTLVTGDDNLQSDVFLRDRVLGTTELVSVATTGGGANGASGWGALDISDDGRIVAFSSHASNLVPNDTNGKLDVFVRDRTRASCERVSVSDSGAQASERSFYPSMSASGRVIAFVSYATLSAGSQYELHRVWVRDRSTGRTEPVAVSSSEEWGSGYSWEPAVSADGRLVVFRSNSPNLAPNDPDSGDDLLVRDRALGTTARLGPATSFNLTSWTNTPPSISRDNRLVIALVPLSPHDTPRSVRLFDRTTGGEQTLDLTSDGSAPTAPARSGASAVSADGRVVAFVSDANNLVLGDTNDATDVFVFDRLARTTRRVSVSSSGDEGDRDSSKHWRYVTPALSADGRFVAFYSVASNLVTPDETQTPDVFVHDCILGTTERVNLTNDGTRAQCDDGPTSNPSISADGRYVTFMAFPFDLPWSIPPPAYGTYVRDRLTNRSERVNVSSAGEAANGQPSFYAPAVISANGRYVAFDSRATNLVAGDTNDVSDIFVRDREAGSTVRVSVGTNGMQADGWSTLPAISADGRIVAFNSYAQNLLPSAGNEYSHVFAHHIAARRTELITADLDGKPGATGGWLTSVSGDGRYVAFDSHSAGLTPEDRNGRTSDAFVRDRAQRRIIISGLGADGTQPPVAPDGIGDTRAGGISADGRFVSFESSAPNLVAGDTNGTLDVFLRDQGDALPAAPAVTVRPISPTEIRLTWRDLSTNESGFVVERRTGPTPGTGLFMKIATLGSNVTAYTGGGLQPGSAYTFRVRAFNWRGDSPSSNEASAVTLPPPPSAPINLAAQALSSTEIKLIWRDTSGTETGFKIERKSGTSGFFAQIGTVGANVTTFTSTGLFPRSTYTYRVRAHNGTTNSGYSNEAAATTSAP